MEKIFNINSIVVVNIKMGVKIDDIRSIFSKFGKILKVKTQNGDSGTFRAYIKFADTESINRAIKSETIICRGLKLGIRKAFNPKKTDLDNRKLLPSLSNTTNHLYTQNLKVKRCNCLICNSTTLDELLSSQKQILKDIQEFHLAKMKGLITENGLKKLAKAADADLKYIVRKMRESII